MAIITAVLALAVLAIPGQAEAGLKLSLKKADEVNRQYLQDNCSDQGFSRCESWATTPCRRVSWMRAVCFGMEYIYEFFPHGGGYSKLCHGDSYLKKDSTEGAKFYDFDWECWALEVPDP